ncbi:MAG: site-specific integrase [Ferruginibacter sp.]
MKAVVILDTRRVKADDTYPVKLRVTFDRKQKYYATPYGLTKIGFKRVMFGERLSAKDKELKKKIQAFEDKATGIIESLPFFTWVGFEKHYLSERAAKGTIKQAFENYAADLREAGRIGTAVSYECAMNSLNTFAKDSKFTDITPELLGKYEKWVLSHGKSITTVGIYLRSLRTIFNNAIAEGSLLKEFYPFGKRKYEIPTGNNTKKALTLSDIGMIYNYKAEPGTMRDRAKDYWIFMYLCNGINTKDLCLLKYENIKGDVLEFIRAKTARTKRKVEPIRVSLTEDLKAIIQKWGNANKDASNYIFPVLSKGITPDRERQLIQQLTHVINDHTKAIAKELEINNDVTTYTARHSFATTLKRSGLSTDFISEALGHSNVKTTQNYLAGFEDGSKREAAKALTAFKETEIK